jgi:hypothetical protein
MIDAQSLGFLRDFYEQVEERSLDPADAEGQRLYVPLYDDPQLSHADPVELLAGTIDFSRVDSVQLFSGFRGTGKSTELHRLRARLRKAGYMVALCDLRDYVNLSMPIDISDFLVTLAGAFSDALTEPDMLGADMASESYWTRFASFVSSFKVDGLDLKVGSKVGAEATLKLGLKQDPSFKSRIQAQLKNHLGALVQDVNQFMAEAVKKLRQRHQAANGFVLLLDSVEQIRGTSVNAADVQGSVETLFVGHAEKLRFQSLHVVYTVPPWLKIRSPGVEGLYSNGQVIPCVKVRDQEGRPFQPGLDAIERLVAKRGDWRRLLGPNRATFDKLAVASGGYLRDLLRLLKTCILYARQMDALPLSTERIDFAIDEIRNDYLPIATQDALWLDRVRLSRDAALPAGDKLPDLSRFFETHLVLCYRNGKEWYATHPLIEEEVGRQAAAERARESERQAPA